MENIRLQPGWKKSKEQIWNDHFDKLTSSSQITRKKFPIGILYLAAAVFFVLLVIPGLYVKTETALRGEKRAITLPDGSKVVLNSQSEIRYKPVLWIVDRSLHLKGEAYFDVEKGKNFDVMTDNGTVSVLGTSFNVYSRDKDFCVTCYTGKVAVNIPADQIVLVNNSRVEISEGSIKESTSGKFVKSNSWTGDRFFFLSVDLAKVFQEIERQYDIDIKIEGELDFRYTGNFDKLENPRDLLEIVTTPFGLTFFEKDNVFVIKSMN
ncbi:hypothetical protein SDC9_54487 [bioreactor metagenome]|jgi:ferric-dicitrate binding protein FerR (iron transport regulator)|uniref:Uncharacterized protein n=1 Tax=bioreactor metagenome TaxID=1076179 RepID=A0A644WW71_9ZZZZ|nr:FecR domain-containing protein [Rikenellaceae bacterium]